MADEKKMNAFQIKGDVLVKYTGTDQHAVIPEKVRVIGEKAFSECTAESIEIPEGVTEIGEFAFSNSWKLKSIVLPQSIQSIGTFAFQNCGELTQITIPDDVKKFGGLVFDGCTALSRVSMAENEYTQSCKMLGYALSFMAGKTLLLEVRMKDGTNRKMVIS